MTDYKNIEIRAAEGLHEDCLALFAQYVPAGNNVIDLAAGAGAFAARLCDGGYNVTANDIDEENWAAPHVPKLAINLDGPLEGVLAPSAYLGVVAMEVIEHLENPSKLLRDCKRLVQPGGYILLSTPNVLDLESRLIFLRRGHFFHYGPQSFLNTGHRTILPRWLLEILIDEAGLDIVQCKMGGVIPKPSVKGPRSWAARFLRAGLRLLSRETARHELDSNYIIYILKDPSK